MKFLWRSLVSGTFIPIRWVGAESDVHPGGGPGPAINTGCQWWPEGGGPSYKQPRPKLSQIVWGAQTPERAQSGAPAPSLRWFGHLQGASPWRRYSHIKLVEAPMVDPKHAGRNIHHVAGEWFGVFPEGAAEGDSWVISVNCSWNRVERQKLDGWKPSLSYTVSAS